MVFDKETLDKDAKGRYTGIHWAYCLYERMWSLRGMENILCDFYENPEHVHRFMDALTDFHCAMIRKGAKELEVDSVWTTDDIGMQTGPMFSPAVFKEFFKPRYARMVKTAHDCGLHFWLHTCGDVRLFMDDLIEVGMDVIHPIQKYTMDEREIAERFGGKICVWTGMDVQQILPRGSTDDVRREVRFMIDTFDRPDGGCMVTAGNGITPDVPVENLLAFYDETYNYGMAHRAKR
jgi:uroporphyrinogen-III decarboxylase